MFSPKPKDKLSRYTDPLGGMSGKDLVRAEWLVRHRLILRRAVIGLLLAWSAITVGYSSWQWGDYFLFGWNEDRRLAAEVRAGFVNYALLHDQFGARPVVLNDFAVYRGADDQYDFAAIAENPNADWLAAVTYYAVSGGKESDPQTAVILPGERRPIAVLGQKSSGYTGDAEIRLSETRWQRINPHVISDPAAYMAERRMFDFDNVRFRTDDGAPMLLFDLHNFSAYSFWQTVFYIELLQGSGKGGILYLAVDKFVSGESRAISLGLPGAETQFNDIAIYPAVNVFDPEVYLPPGASSKQSKQ